jgi:hypothetical protein
MFLKFQSDEELHLIRSYGGIMFLLKLIQGIYKVLSSYMLFLDGFSVF